MDIVDEVRGKLVDLPEGFHREVGSLLHRSADEIQKLRNTLMWTFDRLSVCGADGDRLTQREQLRTMREIGKVLSGEPSVAARYTPEATDESSKVIMTAAAAAR